MYNYLYINFIIKNITRCAAHNDISDEHDIIL